MAVLNRRIASAASVVCGGADIRNLGRAALIDRCRRNAMAGAAPKVASLIEHARTGNAYASGTGITVAAR